MPMSATANLEHDLHFQRLSKTQNFNFAIHFFQVSIFSGSETGIKAPGPAPQRSPSSESALRGPLRSGQRCAAPCPSRLSRPQCPSRRGDHIRVGAARRPYPSRRGAAPTSRHCAAARLGVRLRRGCPVSESAARIPSHGGLERRRAAQRREDHPRRAAQRRGDRPRNSTLKLTPVTPPRRPVSRLMGGASERATR